MTQPLRFTKQTAAGNDFLCLNNLDGQLDALLAAGEPATWAARLCRRGLGVGADGVIVACPLPLHPLADIRARFFEPDGSEVELCGNGTACFVQWALDEGLVAGPDVRVLTPAGIASGRRSDDAGPGRVRVCIPQPHDLQFDRAVKALRRSWTVHTLITGVPHAVVYVEDLAKTDVVRWGRALRWHRLFQPRGINVNFCHVLEPGHLAVRTFEFGVEDETLACGTGSASAAIVSALRLQWPAPYRCGEEPVRVDVRGGETLRVWFCAGAQAGDAVANVCLEARVRTVYRGELDRAFWADSLAVPGAGTGSAP